MCAAFAAYDLVSWPGLSERACTRSARSSAHGRRFSRQESQILTSFWCSALQKYRSMCASLAQVEHLNVEGVPQSRQLPFAATVIEREMELVVVDGVVGYRTDGPASVAQGLALY